MYAFGHVLEEGSGNFVVARVLAEIYRDQQLLSFGIDIADFDTAFVVEEDPVALHITLLASCHNRGVWHYLLPRGLS